jgi:RNA polymerase sigma factor (sigma-70 family)
MEGTDGALVVALVGAAKAGDAAAFRELVERHGGRVFQVAYRITGNEQDAEDAVQETFLRAYRQIGRFDGNSSFGTWLYRIAANCALDAIRVRGRQPGAETPKFRPGNLPTREQMALLKLSQAYLAMKAGSDLRADYLAQKDRAAKQGIIDGYASKRNAEGVQMLIAIARVESDPGLKRKIVEHLIDLNTPEAREYLLEILK